MSSKKNLAAAHHAINPLIQYQYGFSQPLPGYGICDDNGWRTIHRPLSAKMLGKHLSHELSLGSYGRWYPHFGILDFDDTPLERVYHVCAEIGLTSENSVIFTSVSPNSWHVYFKPTHHGREVTLTLYARAMWLSAKSYKIEVYPQEKRVIRLPFGRGQKLVLDNRIFDVEWQAGMDLLRSIDDFDIGTLEYFDSIPQHGNRYAEYEELVEWKNGYQDSEFPAFLEPIVFDFGLHKGWKQEGLELYNTGLIMAGSRLDSLKKVIYFFWSQNLPPSTTTDLVQEWIRQKNNGNSVDYRRNPHKVDKQIEKMTDWMYDNFDQSYTLPDSAHVVDKGYLTPSLVQEIVRASTGKLPLLKFGLNLFAYLAPRTVYSRSFTESNKIAVHSDRLVDWASNKTYLAYLDHYKAQGLIKRDGRYRVGKYAKGISAVVRQPSFSDAIMIDAERPAGGVHEIIPSLYSPIDFAKQLKVLGVERRSISMQLEEIYPKEARPSPVRIKKASTQERISTYRTANPNATQQEIAKALNINQSTISRNMKN
jgi:Winged helix-turn-helix DNA-binding